VLPVSVAEDFFPRKAQAVCHAGAVNSSAVTKRTMGKSPHQIVLLVVKSSRLRCAASPPFALCFAVGALSEYGPPDSKYIHIDAFRRETVTRETLLRYTLKSVFVNNLISGDLWKNLPLSANQGSPSLESEPAQPKSQPYV
jgi:hypothetical protein